MKFYLFGTLMQIIRIIHFLLINFIYLLFNGTSFKVYIVLFMILFCSKTDICGHTFPVLFFVVQKGEVLSVLVLITSLITLSEAVDIVFNSIIKAFLFYRTFFCNGHLYSLPTTKLLFLRSNGKIYLLSSLNFN